MAPDFLTLLRVGFTEPVRSPGPLVVSYTTVSPLPFRGTAVCSLWHFPAGHPGWLLATTLPCGARTFLGAPPVPGRCDAVARPAHPWASVTARWRAGQSGRPPGWLTRTPAIDGSGLLAGPLKSAHRCSAVQLGMNRSEPLMSGRRRRGIRSPRRAAVDPGTDRDSGGSAGVVRRQRAQAQGQPLPQRPSRHRPRRGNCRGGVAADRRVRRPLHERVLPPRRARGGRGQRRVGRRSCRPS